MHLGSYNSVKQHYDLFRALTEHEMKSHAAFTPVIAEARNRLSLFRMLDRNYNEWRAYLNQLLSPSFKEHVDVSEELNRLLLNYLTFAYTIQEHFTVSYRQRHKRDADTLMQYDKFIDRLCQACWPFAFLMDYRGYVQHVGLGVGRNNRIVNDSSVRIEVVANAESLLAESRQWNRSKLTQEMGEIDLIAVLKEFHIQMLQSYAVFVAKTFFPELHPASEFYASLTNEVHERDNEARMIFYSGNPEWSQTDDAKAFTTLDFIIVPNDLFAEIGIKIKNG